MNGYIRESAVHFPGETFIVKENGIQLNNGAFLPLAYEHNNNFHFLFEEWQVEQVVDDKENIVWDWRLGEGVTKDMEFIIPYYDIETDEYRVDTFHPILLKTRAWLIGDKTSRSRTPPRTCMSKDDWKLWLNDLIKGVIVKDKDGNVIFVNGEWKE